jgi:TonB family protein
LKININFESYGFNNQSLKLNKMKTVFFTLLTIFLSFELFAQQLKTKTVYFDYDKYHLTTEAKTILDSFYRKLKTDTFDIIKIIGHTDADGKDHYNLTLSKNRTKSVSVYLQSKGISKDKIQIQFYGEKKPIAKNDSEQDKQQNRRVELILEKGKSSDKDNFEKQAQLFCIPSNKDTTIICKEGTMIKIKANSFISEKNEKSKNKRINFLVTEYCKTSDILLSNLSTTSNGQLLETEGMVHIKANINNQPLKLLKGKTIEINFPTKKKENDMQLFSGSWEDNKHIDWTAQSAEINFSPEYFSFVEEMPTFIGGEKKLNDYLSQTVKYPEQAKKSGVEGTVYVSAVINKNGEVTEPQVVKGVTSELDLVALDAIKKMPNWIPGIQKGRYVPVNFTIPVKFNLSDTSIVVHGIFKEKFEKSYKDTSLQKASSENIMYYVFNTTDLGWINAGRFVNKYPKINFVIKLDRDIETVKIIFDRYKTVMDVFPVNGKYTFKDVPAGENITIVAIKRVDNKPYLAVKKTKTSTQVEIKLVFKPVTMEILKTEMKKLDRYNK